MVSDQLRRPRVGTQSVWWLRGFKELSHTNVFMGAEEQ